MIRHVEPIDPTAVNDRFDSILQSISLLKKEISSAIGNDDEEKGI